jgi:hypothetical protein
MSSADINIEKFACNAETKKQSVIIYLADDERNK